MQEGDIFECLLDGIEYVVKNIVNTMVALQSREGDKRIIAGADTLTIKSLYRRRKKA
jgi:hypothetical protein